MAKKKEKANAKDTKAKKSAKTVPVETAPVKKEETSGKAKKVEKVEKTADKKAEKKVETAPPSSRLLHQFLPFVLWVVAILLLTCQIRYIRKDRSKAG